MAFAPSTLENNINCNISIARYKLRIKHYLSVIISFIPLQLDQAAVVAQWDRAFAP